MSTETHYVVRNEDGDFLGESFDGLYKWYPGRPQHAHSFTRQQAERLASTKDEATVQRVTINGRPDGLRGQWGDLDNAKAAAEAAVRETWS